MFLRKSVEEKSVEGAIFNKFLTSKITTKFQEFDIVHYSRRTPFISIRIRPKK